MAQIYDTPSRTFGEYLLIPNLTTRECIPSAVSLQTPVVRFKGASDQLDACPLTINVPVSCASRAPRTSSTPAR